MPKLQQGKFIGEEAKCDWCGEAVIWKGEYWEHARTHPRHPGWVNAKEETKPGPYPPDWKPEGQVIQELQDKLADMKKQIEALTAALSAVLDQVDFTSGACRMNEMVGAVLDKRVIENARAALQAQKAQP